MYVDNISLGLVKSYLSGYCVSFVGNRSESTDALFFLLRSIKEDSYLDFCANLVELFHLFPISSQHSK